MLSGLTDIAVVQKNKKKFDLDGLILHLYNHYMPTKLLRIILPIILTGSISSCVPVKKTTTVQQSSIFLRFIDEYIIPYNLSFNNTTVGGLSGIDYDQKSDEYYFISDDRSDINPARYYKARIFMDQKGIDSIRFTDVKYLMNNKGSIYSSNRVDPFNSIDPEAIRYNPLKREIVWSSEGERILKVKDTVLQNPSVNIISASELYDTFPLPANLFMHATELGPRKNAVLESMTFADNYNSLFICTEEPIYEDGPKADLTDKKSYIRIFKFDAFTKVNSAQYAYKLDPITYPSIPANGFKLNGVSDMLNIGSNKFIVIERSFSTGRLPCTIKIFISDLANATDIRNIPSLKVGRDFIPATKKLLLNMDELKIYIDNIEGVTFGPVMPNGHKTLLFIADNNFVPLQRSQLLLFEVIE